MQACNLTCKHCYQEAGHKPLVDELTTDQKIKLVDEMAEEYVPFLAFAGGALTTNTERLVQGALTAIAHSIGGSGV